MGVLDKLHGAMTGAPAGETEAEKRSRLAREAAAKPAEDARKKAEDDAERKRKKSSSIEDYSNNLSSFFGGFMSKK